METQSNDFLEQFRNISNKLKKRFLRKPNVTEACEAFSSLAVHCEVNEMPSYAGLCWIAAARCEGSLNNAPSEVNCLVRAARQFVKAELRDKTIGCPSPANENLQAALNCYNYASYRFPENSPLMAGLNVEIGRTLADSFRLDQNAEQYLRQANGQSTSCLHRKLHTFGLLASSYVECGDYTAALGVFSEMSNILESLPMSGALTDVSLRCELSRVFLLLVLRPNAQKLAPSLAKLLEKYMWSDYDDPFMKVHGMSEHIFLLVQSLVMACQSLDIESLPEVETDLYPYLSTELKGLLRVLVRQYNV